MKGRAALDAIEGLGETHAGQVGRPEVSDSNEPASGNNTLLLQIERRAMACKFEVNLNDGQYPHAADAAIESLDLVEALEGQMTVYRDHSEISRINQLASESPVVVESRLYQLLSYAVELCVETRGAFDITAGPLSKIWGFYRRQGNLPDQEQLNVALQHVGSRWLKLSDDQQTIRFERASVELNLGGIGKGHALDRCAELMLGAEVDDFLLHGGQSSVMARGTRARGQSSRPGWTVGIRHPLRPERRIAEFRLHDRALGTSGTGTQFFHHKGKRYGHILDPRTGWPADTVLSSTAIAPQAASADALATAFYVMGLTETERFCDRHPEIAAILVCPGEKRGTIAVHSFNVGDELALSEEPRR